MKLRRSITILFAMSLSIAALGCSTGSHDGSSMTPEGSGATSPVDGGFAEGRDVISQEAGGLRLSDQRAEHLAGTYVSERDPSLGLRFASEKKDETVAWSLNALDGRELMHVQGSRAEGMILRYGEITLRMAPALVTNAIASTQGHGPPPAFPLPVPSSDRQLTQGEDFVVEGDLARFAEMDSRPELLLLPALSRALGDRGLTGDKLPAAMPLHAFAMTYATSSPAFQRAAASAGEGAMSESASRAQPLLICTRETSIVAAATRAIRDANPSRRSLLLRLTGAKEGSLAAIAATECAVLAAIAGPTFAAIAATIRAAPFTTAGAVRVAF